MAIVLHSSPHPYVGYTHVLPVKAPSGEVGYYDPRILNLFLKASEVLAGTVQGRVPYILWPNGDGAAPVRIHVAEEDKGVEFVGVIMPYKDGAAKKNIPHPIPAWAFKSEVS
jgi:hypothetical protein